MTATGLPEPMSFHASRVHYPSLYRPEILHIGSHKTTERYGIALPWRDIPRPLDDILAEMIMKAKGTKWGLVNIRSARKPRVYATQGPARLAQFKAEIDAMNIPFESLLIGHPLEVHVVFWEKTQGPQSGEIGVSLNAITVDLDNLTIPQPLDDAWSAE